MRCGPQNKRKPKNYLWTKSRYSKSKQQDTQEVLFSSPPTGHSEDSDHGFGSSKVMNFLKKKNQSDHFAIYLNVFLNLYKTIFANLIRERDYRVVFKITDINWL